MAADLTARFQLIDEMSDKLESMAQSGQSMVETFENAGESISASFSTMESGVVQSAQSIDGVAHSIEGAAGNTDHWTDAVGNYSKEMLEAVYSTEELVNMGLKSADALEEMEEMYDLYDRSAEHLNMTLEATTGIQEELTSAMDEASRISSELANNENISAETSERLATAYNEAETALREVQAAEEDAQAAMQEYDAVMMSGTQDMSELESAAERACHAAERLAEANGKATEATEELSKASNEAAEELENAGESGTDALTSISSALAAAGITATLKEIAEAAYELADAFSDAESTVVNATGATGAALDDLMHSTMDAYAAARNADLDSTAGAIGEINTRMALTGQELTDVTGKFLDYASITGTDVVGSVQNVTKIMNQWGVEGSEVEGILDRLAYAGQVSGASVDALSQTLVTGAASFQNAGLSLDNTIQMLADFELAGINSTTAVTAMRTAVNNFSKDGLDANVALQETIQKIAEMGDSSEATALAVSTFGSRAGQQLALAIQNGVISVDTFNATLEDTAGTLETTAEASQTLSQKWEQANHSIEAAFTGALQPTIDSVSSSFADLTNSVGAFLNEHPMVTKAVTAIGIGLGVLVAGITGVVFVMNVAIPAVTAFGVALNTALGPIGWVALGITAITAATGAFIAMSSSADDAMYGLTATTRNQYEELDNLQAEYETAVKTYGETSDEASRLKYQIDDLSASLEQNGQTVEQLAAECDALIEKHNSMMQGFDDATASIKNEEVGNLALIAKLQDMAAASDGSAASQEAMQAVIDDLNGSIDGLNLTYDELMKNQTESIENLKAYARAQAEQEIQQEKYKEYVELVKQQAEEQEQLAKITDEVTAAEKRQAVAMDGISYNFLGQAVGDVKELSAATEALNSATEEQGKLQSAYDETTAAIQRIEKEWSDAANNLGEAAEEAAEQTISAEEAAATAFQSVQDEIMALCTAYDEAYNAAVESFEGQFGLFDEAQANAEASVEAAQKAMDSQLDYWSSYLENINTLKEVSASDLGITQENYEALMAYVQSGSEEAAGLAASMVENINAGNEEAVGKLAETVGQVQEAQSESAAAVAEWQTDFDSRLSEITQSMNGAIEEMDLTPEAEAAAKSTIEGYIAQIEAGIDPATTNATAVADGVDNGLETGVAEATDAGTQTMNNYASAIETSGQRAVTAAQSIASQVSAALTAANTNINVNTTGSVPAKARGAVNAPDMFIAGEDGPELIARAAAYANGTTDSKPFYIAGENGPELIMGEQGSTVFPTQETERILSAIGNQKLSISETINPANITGGGDGDPSVKESLKRIVLEIAGGGSIDISGGTADTDTILDLIMQNIRPALLSILRTDILEEGDLSYDF